jgi:hypothetical protein
MLTRGQAQKGDLGMEVDDLALRPKTSPTAIQDDDGIPPHSPEASPSSAPSNRKRKASSMGLYGRPATSQDAVETQVEVTPSIFGADDEVKLLSKHLGACTSPAPEAEDRTAAGTTPDKAVHLAITIPQPTPPQSHAQIVPRPGAPRAETVALEDVVRDTEIKLPKTLAARPRTAASRHAAHLDRVDEYYPVAGMVEKALSMCATNAPADAEGHYTSTDKSVADSATLFQSTLPRKSRKLLESLARPIGSHASFIQQATAQNRIAGRWKGHLAPFFPQE